MKDDVESFNSIYQELALLIGLENCLKFYQSYKGLTITFPTRLINSDSIKKEIEERFRLKGEISKKEVQRLAIRHELSERQIRRYIKEINQ